MEETEEDAEMKISELQQAQSWSPSVSFYNFQGIWYPKRLIKGIVSFQKNFKPQPTDIFLCTFPKCGTTWLKALSFAILTRSQYMNGDSESPLLSKSPQDLVPYIEDFFAKGKTRDPRNPLIHTHVPFSSLPESVLNSDSKLIYICRDPKDVLVSQFFFASKRFDMVPFEDGCELFCNGISFNGPYWDHVLGYWKAGLELPERVLFLKYEDLKNETSFYAKKIADFMGCGFSVDEETNGTVDRIIRLCSFENLSSLNVNKTTENSVNDGVKSFSNASFFRKGKTGDWKNYLTPRMAEKIDQITHQKFYCHGLNM